ncbi:MAG: hypothetical protein D6703_00745, partial [Zetaproteobacteria bacterium]
MSAWQDQRSLLQHLLGRPADRLLLALVLAGTITLWLILHAFLADERPQVEIYHHEQLLAIYPMPEGGRETRFVANGDLGPT